VAFRIQGFKYVERFRLSKTPASAGSPSAPRTNLCSRRERGRIAFYWYGLSGEEFYELASNEGWGCRAMVVLRRSATVAALQTAGM
jgi:hypothetical protein